MNHPTTIPDNMDDEKRPQRQAVLEEIVQMRITATRVEDSIIDEITAAADSFRQLRSQLEEYDTDGMDKAVKDQHEKAMQDITGPLATLDSLTGGSDD